MNQILIVKQVILLWFGCSNKFLHRVTDVASAAQRHVMDNEFVIPRFGHKLLASTLGALHGGLAATLTFKNGCQGGPKMVAKTF